MVRGVCGVVLGVGGADGEERVEGDCGLDEERETEEEEDERA